MTRPRAGLVLITVAAALTSARADPLDDAGKTAEVECAKVTERLSQVEEHTVGRALTASDVTRHGGLYLDGIVDDAHSFRTITTLAPGAKNELNRYVQRVGARIAARTARRPEQWTFAVLEDAKPGVVYEIGGYIFVTTGLLQRLTDEADLAAAVSLGVSAIGSSDALDAYRQARMRACVLARTGYGLVLNGKVETPGADEFIAAAKYGKLMPAFFGGDSGLVPADAADFSAWYLNFVASALAASAVPADAQARHDADALVLLSSAGYDPGALAIVIALVDPQGSKARIAALDAARAEPTFGMNGGASPPFPKGLPMLQPAANK